MAPPRRRRRTPLQSMGTAQPAAPAQQPVVPAQQPGAFSPPLAMQQSIWDSIADGNFIDAKVFAYSRRAHGSGRVHTPKALFVNTHVLASACGYFRSTFDLSDGIETSLTAGLPPGLDAALDMEENDLDDDYDYYDFAEEDPADPQVLSETRPQVLPERTVKAYLVKYTAYKTLRAIIWYIYSGEIFFSTTDSRNFPIASVESIYRFAEEHGMVHLRSLAFGRITAPIYGMHQSYLLREAFTPFASRYPQIRDVYVRQLQYFLGYGPNEHFREQLFLYFSGELPRSRDLLTSLLQSVMDGPPAGDPSGGGAHDAILRVSLPWPTRTKGALLSSLDRGTFEDIRVAIPSGPESMGQPVYFAGAVDEYVGSTISHLCRPESTSQSNPKISLLTWRAIAYYMYSGCISFKPPGSRNIETTPAYSPSDAQFRGCQCSPRETLYVARQLATYDALVDLAANEVSSQLTPENVVEEMFWNSPTPRQIIDRGVEIIRENRGSSQIHSQLQRILEEAASGDNPENAAAFFACLAELLRGVDPL